MAWVGEDPGLRGLNGDGGPVSSTDFLTPLRSLTSVDLSSSSVRSLRGLMRLDNLNHLCLADCTEVSTYALALVPTFRLPRLATLVLFGVEAATDDIGRAIVTAFPTISHLDLTKTKVGDETLDALAAIMGASNSANDGYGHGGKRKGWSGGRAWARGT